MTLTERGAKFFSENGRAGMGVNFRCPCSPDCDQMISVPFANPISGGGNDGVCWQRQGDTLDTLTLSPSVDFRHAAGDYDPTRRGWHGFVRNGELVTA